MSANGMKAVMYIYNRSEPDADLEFDLSGIFPNAHGWNHLQSQRQDVEVVRTTILDPHVQRRIMPVLKIYLTDQF